MQNYTAIPSSQRISDSLAPLLNNDLTGISRNSGTAFPTVGLQVGMPFIHLTERKLYRLDSLSPITWTVEVDLAKTLVYSESIDTVNDALATKVALSGGVMTGFLTLSAAPTQTLHAATKGYVDAAMTTASASANTRVLKTGDTMTGPLTLPGDPTLDLHAATKRYTDFLFNSFNQSKVNKEGDTINNILNTGWFRSIGATGWYNQTYGSGLYMTDPDYIRVNGAAGFLTNFHQLLTNGQIWTSQYGYLENYFAAKGAEDRITAASTTESGRGTFYNPSGYYLTRSGATVFLVKPRQNCNCDCQCNCSCFPAGTLVLMADGSQKPIETVQVGDLVMGWDGQPDEVDLMEYPILGERRLAGFADGSLNWSEEHLAWTRRDGHEWWGAVSKNWWYAEVLAKHVVGLQDNSTLRELDDERDEFAHVSGWVKRKLKAEKADFNTQLYLPRTKRTHMIIVNGYLMTAGTDGFAVDYTQVNWKGLPHVAA